MEYLFDPHHSLLALYPLLTDTSGNGMAKGSSEGNKSAQKSTEEVKTSGDSSVNANAINAERLQAIGALHLLACRTSADDSVVEGNEHKNHNARMSQSSGGNLSRKQGERLRQTAVFFLEMGFLEPTDEGGVPVLHDFSAQPLRLTIFLAFFFRGGPFLFQLDF